MQERKRLSDILFGSGNGDFSDDWDSALPADDFGPLPPGEYVCRIRSGELFTARSGTPGYKLTLEVTEGEHGGRRLWHDLWLTPAALPMTKRDLGKVGITRPQQMEEPIQQGILVRVRVVVRTDDDGTTYNRIRSISYVGIEPGDAFEPEGDASPDTSFDPALL